MNDCIKDACHKQDGCADPSCDVIADSTWEIVEHRAWQAMLGKYLLKIKYATAKHTV